MSYLTKHKDEIFKKYSKEELIKDCNNYLYNNGSLQKVLNHFFKECIFNCKSNRYKYTPMELLNNDELMQWVLEYIKTKPNFYNGSEITNVESFLRNGTRYARKVTNFNIKLVTEIYNRYNTENKKLNILDTSCGFGSRMSAAILNGHNYFGFDPNKELQEKLFECAKFYYDNGFINSEQKCDLYSIGSENFISELENTIDISFTSPPYFNLETYSNDLNASTENYNNYQAWLKYFVIPTITNTYKYLKVGGYAMINIKNLSWGGKEKLFDDWFEIFNTTKGFKLIEVFDIKLNKRQFTQNCNYDVTSYKGFKEPVMCFQKVR